MSDLMFILIAGLLLCLLAWSSKANTYIHPEDAEAASRRQVIRELEDIRSHRPDHIVKSADEYLDDMT
jgi:hypothetical protein